MSMMGPLDAGEWVRGTQKQLDRNKRRGNTKITFADGATTIAGISTDTAVTPAGLAQLTATATRRGLIEIADLAEVKAGSDTERALVPATFAGARMAGYQGVTPSSLSVASGSASAAADGTVTFTNVGTRLSLNGVFDGTGIDAYMIYAYFTTTTGTTVTTRLRSGATDYSSSDHIYAAHNTSLAGGPSRSASTSASAFGWWRNSAAGTNGVSSGQLLLFNPAKTTSAWGSMTGFGAWNGDRSFWLEGFNHASGSAFTSLSLVLSAGTMSGQIKVVKIG